MIFDALKKWPLIRQIRDGADGTGRESMSEHTATINMKNYGAEVARSICPYCAVGCGQLVFHKQGKLISIEGDPASPISRGHLCPKGSASYELLTHPNRAEKGALSKAAFEAMGRHSTSNSYGYGRGPRLGFSRAQLYRGKSDGQVLMQHHRDRTSGWRHAG